MKKSLLLGSILLAAPLGARMVTVSTLEEFNKYYTSETPLVTMYSAAWCGPCKQMKPYFSAAAEANAEVNFCIIDMDSKGLGPITSDIRSIPTTIFSHKGRPVKRHTSSLTRKELDASLAELRKATLQTPTPQKPSAPSSLPAQKK